LELPPPLRGTESDSFAHRTITVRWPRIAQRVIDENDYPAAITEHIQTLIENIPDGPIRLLDDPGAPDETLWNERIAPYKGQSWLEAPWFFGETYFYRRIIEAIGYYQPTSPGFRSDPFTRQKGQGYTESLEATRTLAQGRAEAIENDIQREELVRLLKTALWGNQADLSMWDADADGPDHLGTGREEEHTLANDASAALDHLAALDRPARVDVWTDNAGFELVTDLALVDGLLTSGLANPLVLHVKAHPTFVSDATVDDVHDALDRFATDEDEATQALADRLRTALRDGRLRLHDPFAWTSPLPARHFPTNVNAELARADLVISKGDANYRRLMGDRHWDFTTPFDEVVSYFPAPLLALRTLKAEVTSGLSQGQVDRLNAQDPDWMTNGRWGLIQFAE
jgi:uncharacterized protein with ATP-grasp and redox domains